MGEQMFSASRVWIRNRCAIQQFPQFVCHRERVNGYYGSPWPLAIVALAVENVVQRHLCRESRQC
jgi:hypothetical protein